jgi:hypothetical protein
MEREQDLRATGAFLDVQAVRDEFLARVRRRQEMNAAAVQVETISAD